MNRIAIVVLTVGVALAASSARSAGVTALNLPGGGNDFASVANSPSVTLNGQMTLEAWVYPTAWRSYTGREKHGLNFMYKGQIGSHIDYVFALQENGILALGNTWGYIGVLDRRIPLNQWTHVAVSVNEATGAFVFYINGENCGAGSGWQGASLSRTSFLEPSSHPLYIGGFYQMGWGYNNDNFIGKLADVRIWNIVRPASDIQRDYLKQLKGNEPGFSAFWNLTDLLDKTGHGNKMTLNGSATLQAGQGPDLQTGGGISVAITSPVNDQIVSLGSTVLISATATNSNSVARVDFYDGANLMGNDVSDPFQFSLTNVSAGVHTLSARATNDIGQVGVSATVTIYVQGPFGGTPRALPGTVECENFDTGGSGVAYNDTTVANQGASPYRTPEQVDIARDLGAGNSNVVGWTKAGEWMEYTVNVVTSGVYTLETRVANAGAGGQFRIEVNGVDQTGVLNVPNTGAWTVYQTVQKTGLSLAAGQSIIRLTMLSNGSSGYVGQFDWFRLVSAGAVPGRAYPSGTPWVLPGTVECENFDTGGSGVAYNDTTVANQGASPYRTPERVDIARDLGAGNSNVVGWTKAGEWMEYTVNVVTSGVYTLETRVSNTGAGGQFRIAVNGVDQTGVLNVPNTGAWTVYQTVQKTGISLAAGQSIIRLTMLANGSSGYVGEFDWFRATKTGEVLVILNSFQPFGVQTSPVLSFDTALTRPVDVRTSDESVHPNAGWAVVDGNPETVWRGEPGAGGWWIVFEYAPVITLNDLRVDWTDGSPTGMKVLYSMDADTWSELVLPLTKGSVSLKYLWLIFPDEGGLELPAVKEVHID